MFDNINLTNIGWTILNLLILFLLLKKFLFGPVTRQMEARQQAISDAIRDAEDKNRQAEAQLGGCSAQIEDAAVQAGRILSEAHTRAQREYDQRLKEAEADARQVLEQAQAQIRLEREQMRAGVRAELAELVLLTAGRLAAARPDAAGDRAMVEAFLSETGDAL